MAQLPPGVVVHIARAADRPPASEQPVIAAAQRIQRQHEAIAAASAVAHARGEQQGYCAGWRKGLLTGIVVGAALATIAWSAYLSIAAPEVAPPSATRPAIVRTTL